MINYLKKNLGLIETYNSEDYPKTLEEKEVEATGSYTTYTIKVVWSDGGEDLMECEAYDLKSNGILELGFIDGASTRNIFDSVDIIPNYDFLRYIDCTDRRYWEVIDKEKIDVKKNVTLEHVEEIKYGDTLKEKWTIKNRDTDYEIVEEDDE